MLLILGIYHIIYQKDFLALRSKSELYEFRLLQNSKTHQAARGTFDA